MVCVTITKNSAYHDGPESYTITLTEEQLENVLNTLKEGRSDYNDGKLEFYEWSTYNGEGYIRWEVER